MEDAVSPLLRDLELGDVKRNDLAVVLNACDLRTGSAFRFGSSESGSWREGTIKNNRVPVARAVACSAAYPLAFPAMDFTETFVRRDGTEQERRVILTDGGVYDNLGTSCLLPNRSAAVSTNVHSVDRIIACDAGRGLFEGHVRPYWLTGRMSRVVESMYQRAQNLERGRLFDASASSPGLNDFVIAMLGMSDNNLPLPITNLVSRSEAVSYATSFNALPEEGIGCLTTRGEQIMGALTGHYLSAS